MAALRSLEAEVAAAVWRREWDRRIRNNHVCNICGQSRDTCTCQQLRDDPYDAIGGEPDGAPA